MRSRLWSWATVRDSSFAAQLSVAGGMSIMLEAGRGQSFGRIGGWLLDQPYLLLALTSLFWAGNTVIGRFIAGHVPPVTLAFIRWGGAFLILLPFALPHLASDW